MLSESPLEQASPFLSTRECPVLWVFVLANVSPCQASSSFFYPFFYRPHTLSDLPNSHLLCFTLNFFQAAHLQKIVDRSRNVVSAGVLHSKDTTGVLKEIYVLLRFFQPLPGTIWVLN